MVKTKVYVHQSGVSDTVLNVYIVDYNQIGRGEWSWWYLLGWFWVPVREQQVPPVAQGQKAWVGSTESSEYSIFIGIH